MYARPALWVVLLVSVARPSHQRSIVSDDYVPAATADRRVKLSAVDATRLHAAVNAIKRHIGKFVRIGRSLSAGDSTLRSDGAFWSSQSAPFVPRLSERVLSSRQRRSDLHDAVVTADKADTSGLLRDTGAGSSAVELHAESKKNRGGGVRFVRIGKTDRQLWTSANQKRSDDMKVFRRSLENRFVRIGK